MASHLLNCGQELSKDVLCAMKVKLGLRVPRALRPHHATIDPAKLDVCAKRQGLGLQLSGLAWELSMQRTVMRFPLLAIPTAAKSRTQC